MQHGEGCTFSFTCLRVTHWASCRSAKCAWTWPLRRSQRRRSGECNHGAYIAALKRELMEATVEADAACRDEERLAVEVEELRNTFGDLQVREHADLTNPGCEVDGVLLTEHGEVPYILRPLVHSGVIRTQIPKHLFERLNEQIDALLLGSGRRRTASHAPFLEGEIKRGRQLTVTSPDEEYVELLTACASSLAKAVLGGEAVGMKYVLEQVWTVHQYEGDYNPLHFHNNRLSHFGFSSFLHLRLPPQLQHPPSDSLESVIGDNRRGPYDGMTTFVWNADSRDGCNEDLLELPGSFSCELVEGILYVFPQWLQHLVWPFRGAGERRTLAANVAVLSG